MKYAGMPIGMWMLFGTSFEKNLVSVLQYTPQRAKEIKKDAEKRYREIIRNLPEFEKEDSFTMNIVNCALFSAFYLNLDRKPSLEDMTQYYKQSMMTKPMHWFCKMSGKNKFTQKDIEGMKKTAAFKAADRNPYSWNMDFYPYENNEGYEARFTKCGICTLMKELGIQEIIPAMCRLDYTMSEAGGTSDFVREYTLASGGPYCDCGYHKKVGKR
ncbi:MAG: L-2-amino-thiazoline-4-carboxylic acid hydrolase [Solobacterium sp.]|nr:L-2-amino-thiazoline-4-carboxylic acid hydrolase [Solobacterium sp.]